METNSKHKACAFNPQSTHTHSHSSVIGIQHTYDRLRRTQHSKRVASAQ